MRAEKASIVSDLSEKLKRSPFMLVADYQRMKVDNFGELRTRLAPVGAEVHVVKNNFLKRAMVDSGLPDVGDKLVGQTAVVTGEKDVAPVAKILCVGTVDLSSWRISILRRSGEIPTINVGFARIKITFPSSRVTIDSGPPDNPSSL